MNNRWQMNRIGFVNFWLYDNEVFDLENGKILIRGTNGSGKSITTQSIVSFILDGNRSPERLDTFGSSDRKMEYYFLGDNSEKTEGTGYIFLELKKRGTEQYKTIGIGQKAQRGKPMQFWGFVLSDGRRVGRDFELYKNIGSGKRQVLDKNELERNLGEKNKFVTKTKEYMEMINKEFFGFTDINYYQKLIKFLLKIRTSKLSTDIKPANVHEILNDSLQILEENDLRILAESLEKMDEMQETNERQKEERKVLKILKKEYDRYNKILLQEKAKNYLKAKNEYEILDRKIKNINKELEKIEKVKKENTDLKFQIEKRLEIIEQESRLLRNIDLEKNVAELRNAKLDLESKEKEIFLTEEELQKHRHSFNKKEAEKKDELRKKESIKNDIKEYYFNMSDINDTINFYGHFKEENEFFEKDIYSKIEIVRNNIEIYKENIHSALEILRKYKILSENLERCEEEFSYIMKEKDKAYEENQKAEELEDRARDNLIEKFYVLKENNEFLKISKSELEKIEELIKKYEGLSEGEEIKKILEKNYNLKNQELSQEKIRLNFEKEKTGEELKKEITELESLKNKKETAPERDVEKERCREELKKAEIPFVSFYEAVDFAENLAENEKNILEAQLKESGILDSLIIPKAFREKAHEIIKKYSDLILDIKDSSNEKEKFLKLRVEDIDTELKETVEVFLKNISLKEDGNLGKLVLEENGYFRNGVLKGYASKNYTASFIGVQTRREKLKNDILIQEEKCKFIENSLKNISAFLEETEIKLKVLKSEYQNIPEFSDLNTAIHLRKESEYILEKAAAKTDEKEKQLLEIKSECQQCDRKIIENCKILPFKRNIDEYEEGEQLVREYILILNKSEKAVRDYHLSISEIIKIEEIQEKEEDLIEFCHDKLRKNRNELEKIQNIINKLKEIINSPENIAAAEKIKKLQNEEENLKIQKEKINMDMVREEENCKFKREQLKEYTEQEAEKKRAFSITQKYFQEEMGLKFVDIYGENLYETAESIIKSSDEKKNITVEDAVSSLNKVYRIHSGKFDEYMISMDDIFESDPLYTRKRFIITMQREGTRISLYDFENLLNEEIERREFAIEKEDRKLIEDVLSGNIGHKLIDYINESRKWIKEMSKIMQEMDTSMKMKFSMDWKAKSKAADSELEISELEVLLNKSNYLLSDEDLNKISQHFKSKLDYIREEIKNSEGELNYVDSIKKVLDYREWFEFKLYYQKHGENKKELTNSAFNKFSGGEKAMSIYIPLLAAASAQYKKAKEDCPRIIALDETFAGIDDKNIDSMFELIEKLDFDYIMNSQILWGDCKSVKGLRIAELINKKELNMIVVNRFFWDGNKRYLVI